MYPQSFHYYRANSLKEALTMLAQLGEEAKLLAGGQSLIPLMKLRFANPRHLVDINFIPNVAYIKEDKGRLRFGALTRHAEIEDRESDAAGRVEHRGPHEQRKRRQHHEPPNRHAHPANATRDAFARARRLEVAATSRAP